MIVAEFVEETERRLRGSGSPPTEDRSEAGGGGNEHERSRLEHGGDRHEAAARVVSREVEAGRHARQAPCQAVQPSARRLPGPLLVTVPAPPLPGLGKP